MKETSVNLYRQDNKIGWIAYRGGRPVARSGCLYYKPVEARNAFKKFLKKTFTEGFTFKMQE